MGGLAPRRKSRIDMLKENANSGVRRSQAQARISQIGSPADKKSKESNEDEHDQDKYFLINKKGLGPKKSKNMTDLNLMDQAYWRLLLID